MVGVMTVMATSFKRTCSCTAVFSAPDPQQAAVDPPLCRRHLDTHRQVWLSLLWGHCSFLLAPGAHKVLFVPSKSLPDIRGFLIAQLVKNQPAMGETLVRFLGQEDPLQK